MKQTFFIFFIFSFFSLLSELLGQQDPIERHSSINMNWSISIDEAREHGSREEQRPEGRRPEVQRPVVRRPEEADEAAEGWMAAVARTGGSGGEWRMAAGGGRWPAA
jgi:hypothetical protein